MQKALSNLRFRIGTHGADNLIASDAREGSGLNETGRSSDDAPYVCDQSAGRIGRPRSQVTLGTLSALRTPPALTNRTELY